MSAHRKTRKEVFAWFGGAVYAAQCFEVELCILLLIVRRLQAPSCTEQELEELDSKLSKKTMGALLRELGKHLTIHPDFQAMLDAYVDRRNYLMHHFFSDHSADLLTKRGCLNLIKELQDHYSTLKEADEIAQAMSKHMRKQLGIPEAELQALVDAELHRLSDE